MPLASCDLPPNSAYRGRFAPSPTGPLHLGSLYTALAGFLQARKRGGQWLLRIDDLDPYRSLPGTCDRIQSALEACGLHWDGAIVHQARRAEPYRSALDRLRASGLLYPCLCSRRDLSQGSTTSSSYPGFCRGREFSPDLAPHAIRIATAGIRISFRDRLQGPCTQNLETEAGDFVLFRRDRVYAYHLATVVDDAEQGITEVLRGQDLLDSTPRQIFLQQRLGLPTPEYAHIPILVDGHGRKLSKQTFAPEASTRKPGPLLFHLLCLLNQFPPRELATAPAAEILSWAIPHWDISRLRGIAQVPVEPARFQP